MNVFLPRDDGEKRPILVDFASTGIGFGMRDVAMHVRHAIRPEDLDKGQEEEIVRRSWEYLQTLSVDSEPRGGITSSLSSTMRDSSLVACGRMPPQKRCTRHKRRDKKNVNLINRSIPAAMAFVRNVEAYLTEIEQEGNNPHLYNFC